MQRRTLAAIISLCLAAPAFAQDELPYVDDRSSPEAVVTSFYNAINRGEFARAYSYYQEGEGVGDYNEFVTGYADTVHVEVTTRAATSEGAAGSIYYTLPVAIDARETDGRHAGFAGCYTLRLVNPQLQEPPFRPLHIVSGTLHAVPEGTEPTPPEDCAP
jgi:hypothetical protein